MGRVTVSLIVILCTLPISLMVNRIVPEPYMDEIFHVPQAQQYCRGDFKTWDPMITTPPGLYYLSLVHIAPLFPGMWYLKVVSSFSELCSAAILRSINCVLAVICGVLVYEIITHLRPSLDERKATLQAVVLSLFPLHWFFTFLYYTDVASLTMVLAMYLACLKRHYRFSALLGTFSIYLRQTNVVWVLLVACTGAINLAFSQNSKDKKQLDNGLSVKKLGVLADNKSFPRGPNLRKRNLASCSSASNHPMSKASMSQSNQSSGLIGEVQTIILRLWLLKWEVFMSFSPFLLVVVAFISFVCWNGSIVLGAKEAHAVSPHFAQMMYFALFSVLAMAPFHICFSQVAFVCQSFLKNKKLPLLQVLIAFTAGFFSVHFFSIAHPYLLADNRHYTFYIWRKVIRAHWLMKYLLLPMYVYSWFSIFNNLGKAQKKIWRLAFFLACAGVLIPAPLVEFRYYTIPFFFLVLHTPTSDNRSWLLIGLLYIVVNVFTMTMFLFRPFRWSHEPGTQRFIW
ncbi:hypothetical protein Sjap_001767 [Stephania japonica]|uniref:Dol-P-Glc:Glc(2)Man(9)GlcNAc(2)-PP-Dol alpha-1,2-glucosyltransferase n=1 Tax=Stephania japonica TaxID=461633 RepID=A0AAP0KKJ7_9MAGN